MTIYIYGKYFIAKYALYELHYMSCTFSLVIIYDEIAVYYINGWQAILMEYRTIYANMN